ncbi:methyltransferase [Sinorhizobium meliloti]|nr:methyltransferase [Sinorhizobium meliloti]
MDARSAVECLRGIVEIGGPDPGHYLDIVNALNVIHAEDFVVECGLAKRIKQNEDLVELIACNREVFDTTASMQGFVRSRPHGYAGDFEIIERIYNRTISAAPVIAKWDAFFHTAHAAEAVRNRAAILQSISADIAPNSLLSVGSGPGLDLRPLIRSARPPEHVTLLDNDANAISRSRANLLPFVQEGKTSIETECRNALRWKSERKFDLVWSSGLFDYLADKTASFLLGRLRQTLTGNGVVVIGNFSHENPSRAYSEVIGEWLLIHRDPKDLVRLAVDAGFDRARVEVTSDPTGVNLFLVARA